MNFDVFTGVKFVLAVVSCLLHKQSSGDKTCWKTQYHMYLLKYHPCFVWAGSEQFCPVSRERPDRDQGIEGSTAAQGKELEASAAEKGSQPGMATRTWELCWWQQGSVVPGAGVWELTSCWCWFWFPFQSVGHEPGALLSFTNCWYSHNILRGNENTCAHKSCSLGLTQLQPS